MGRLAIDVSFLFRNESFSFEALRAAGAAPYDGADLGEVLATTRLIRDGDLNDWLSGWRATAKRVHELARTSIAAGHRVSARQAFLRASNYYRTAARVLSAIACCWNCHAAHAKRSGKRST